jgi:ribonuclease P/MRP protein subunit RPP1
MAEFYDLCGVKSPDWTREVDAVIISKNVIQEARKKRENEIIIAEGDDKTNRDASDCWEVDMIGSPELHNDKDFMHQMNSGIDYVIAKACAEKGIAVQFSFANVLNSHGRKRSQILARMRQNVMICRKTQCDMIVTTGSKGIYETRSPRDMIAFGIVIGMTPEEAKKAVSDNPKKLLERSMRRNDENILLNGLLVKKWGSPKKEKKIYGWY